MHIQKTDGRARLGTFETPARRYSDAGFYECRHLRRY